MKVIEDQQEITTDTISYVITHSVEGIRISLHCVY